MKLSVLDLAPVPEGTSAADALRATAAFAEAADRFGYHRLWYAEHHGIPNIASASPEVLIGHAAERTRRIRVGSGGVMLPNHVPLRVVETYRTLEALYPGRIDLGIGRAGGSDSRTLSALKAVDGGQFAQQMAELIAFETGGFPDGHPYQAIEVVPGEVSLPPIWLLGSSGASAEFSGLNGFGYAFAGHFSPAPAAPAFQAYRHAFKPSDDFPGPKTLLCLAAICAPSEEEAAYLAGSMELAWLRLRQGGLRKLASPQEAADYAFTPQDHATVEAYRRIAITGTPDKVRREIEARAVACDADEVMVTTNVWDPEARVRSLDLLARAFDLPRPSRAAVETQLAW
ncbi:LLM class flavin-dependent oxidoreductase [Afifella marina]|uniref:LLM class flavin-dependent oxidoreductase n=1 Tax=Afifella marina TaxID=1080 RepID=UPI001FCCC887|nr:LLM class flavin-dependent oxidoreductase [Afifella marina]